MADIVTHEEVEEIPTILTQVSKEKFRRRLLIASRFLAVMLILSIFYLSYTTYITQTEYGELLKEAGNAPCFVCGYNYGMACQYVYVNRWYNEEDKEEFLLSLGYSNVNQSRTQILGGLPQYEVVNFSKFNLSE